MLVLDLCHLFLPLLCCVTDDMASVDSWSLFSGPNHMIDGSYL